MQAMAASFCWMIFAIVFSRAFDWRKSGSSCARTPLAKPRNIRTRAILLSRMINLKLRCGKDETNDRLPYAGCRRASPAANVKFAQFFLMKSAPVQQEPFALQEGRRSFVRIHWTKNRHGRNG